MQVGGKRGREDNSPGDQRASCDKKLLILISWREKRGGLGEGGMKGKVSL